MHPRLLLIHIPKWYHEGMSKQIAVRLPDDIVDFVDRLVADGEANSRAVVVARALARERRRLTAAQDAAILAEAGADPDLDSLAGYVTHAPLDLD
jgi:Arc/MetJ-type ribon-helix-helix transcriptional regulator